MLLRRTIHNALPARKGEHKPKLAHMTGVYGHRYLDRRYREVLPSTPHIMDGDAVVGHAGYAVVRETLQGETLPYQRFVRGKPGENDTATKKLQRPIRAGDPAGRPNAAELIEDLATPGATRFIERVENYSRATKIVGGLGVLASLALARQVPEAGHYLQEIVSFVGTYLGHSPDPTQIQPDWFPPSLPPQQTA